MKDPRSQNEEFVYRWLGIQFYTFVISVAIVVFSFLVYVLYTLKYPDGARKFEFSIAFFRQLAEYAPHMDRFYWFINIGSIMFTGLMILWFILESLFFSSLYIDHSSNTLLKREYFLFYQYGETKYPIEKMKELYFRSREYHESTEWILYYIDKNDEKVKLCSGPLAKHGASKLAEKLDLPLTTEKEQI